MTEPPVHKYRISLHGRSDWHDVQTLIDGSWVNTSLWTTKEAAESEINRLNDLAPIKEQARKDKYQSN